MGQAGSALSEEQLQQLMQQTKLKKEQLRKLNDMYIASGTPKMKRRGSIRLRKKSSSAQPNPELGKDQFTRILEEAQIASGEAAEKMFDIFDTDGNSSVSLDEFLKGFSILLNGEPREKLSFIFKAYDVDDSKSLTKDELELLAQQMKRVYQAKKLTAEGVRADVVIDSFCRSLDSDGDGIITEEEFVSEGLKNEHLLPLIVTPLFANSAVQEQVQKLLKAAARGELKAVEKYIDERELDVNSHGENGETALYSAAKRHPEVVEFLLERGARVDILSVGGRSALHRAAEGSLRCVKALLTAGADPNVSTAEGWTPLHGAVSFSEMENVKALVKAGARVEVPTLRGENALHIAAQFNQPKAIRVLVMQYKVAVDSHSGDENFTPLHFACRTGSLAAAKELVDLHADVDALSVYGSTPLMELARHCPDNAADIADVLMAAGADPKIADESDGMTALHWAAKVGNAALCQQLGANRQLLSLQNHEGQIPLNVAHSEPVRLILERCFLENLSDVSKELLDAAKKDDMERMMEQLKKGADVNTEDAMGYTALYFAILNRNAKVVRALINAKATVTFANEKGSLLHAAVMTGNVEVVRLLLEAGADVRAVEKEWSMMPIHTAALRGKEEVVKVLLEYDHNLLYAKSSEGRLAVHWAAYRGQAAVLELLLEWSGEYNAPNEHGQTPMHMACAHARLECMKVLGKKKSVFRSKDESGRCAIHHAALSGNAEAISFCMQAAPELISLPDGNGNTVLHNLCESEAGQAALPQLWKRMRPLANCANSAEETPLHVAAAHGTPSGLQLLVKMGCDTGGGTKALPPIYYAARARRKENIQFLRFAGCKFAEEGIKDEEIVFEEEAADYPVLGSATRRKLVEYLLVTFDFIQDVSFREDVVLAYREFMTEKELLDTVLELWDAKYLLLPHNTRVRLCALRFLGYWIKNDTLLGSSSGGASMGVSRDKSSFNVVRQWQDASTSSAQLTIGVFSSLKLFLEGHAKRSLEEEDDVDEEESEAAAALFYAQRQLKKKRKKRFLTARKLNRGTIRPLSSNAKPLTDPEKIAEQLALMSKELWKDLTLSEFYHTAFAKKNAKETSPHINRFIDHFNRLSDFVVTTILSDTDAKKRAAIVMRWIAVAQRCLAIADFSDMVAITTALQNTTVERLKKTMELVKAESMAKLQALKAVTDPRGNHKSLRAAAFTHEVSVPFIGLIMSDLIHAEEITKKVEGRFNWHRFRLVARSLSAIVKNQKADYPFQQDLNFQFAFETMEVLEGDAARQKSRELEPPPAT